jgi:hypothetical protein
VDGNELGPMTEGDRDAAVAWSDWREAAALVLRPRQLRRSATIALVVGTILFAVNQLDVVLRADATAAVWLKAGLTYLVPFCVANAGLLASTKRSASKPDDRPSSGAGFGDG